MALYLGEAVRIRASATDPETGLPLDPPPISAVVDFWGPAKAPIRNLADRGQVDVANRSMTLRPLQDDFVLFQPTSGDPWMPGKWTYRVTMIGEAFSNWEYATFVLKA